MKPQIIILLLCSAICFSQQKLSLSVYQDTKLLITGDNKGNDPLTPDLIFNMDWEGKQQTWYYFSIKTQYEFANLVGGKFYRYTVNGICNFNKLIVPKMEFGIGLGFGALHRPNTDGLGTYSLTTELNYPLTKNIKASVKYEIVRRSDLVELYHEPQPFKPNLAIGFRITIIDNN